MDLQQAFSPIREALRETRVFGEPIERDGVTVIPATSVRGGGGGGMGRGTSPSGGEGDLEGAQAEGAEVEGTGGAAPQGEGAGGGFGLTARPAGAYVIRDGQVSWQPAVDVNRMLLGGQVVAIVALLVLRQALRARSRRGRR